MSLGLPSAGRPRSDRRRGRARRCEQDSRHGQHGQQRSRAHALSVVAGRFGSLTQAKNSPMKGEPMMGKWGVARAGAPQSPPRASTIALREVLPPRAFPCPRVTQTLTSESLRTLLFSRSGNPDKSRIYPLAIPLCRYAGHSPHSAPSKSATSSSAVPCSQVHASVGGAVSGFTQMQVAPAVCCGAMRPAAG